MRGVPPSVSGVAFTIRPATIDDVPACATILNQWIDATPWMPRVHSPADVERHYRDHVLSAHRVMVAETDGQVCGFLALTHEGLVSALYISARTRRQGVGKALLDHAKAARPQGVTLWTFVANSDARRFYDREGFTEVRRTASDNEEGLPDVLMAWGPEAGE